MAGNFRPDRILGPVVLLLLLASAPLLSAQTCGEMGGDHCSDTGYCPPGYELLGESSDCAACCLQGPSCGDMGGDHCSPTASCPAGYESLGASADCLTCCRELPSCGEMGGDHCSQTDSCPPGYQSLGESGDCPTCCRRGPSCGEMGGDHCSQTDSCPAWHESLGTSWDCPTCCQSQAVCGNGVCDAGESCSTCVGDCALEPTFTASATRVRVGEPIAFIADPAVILDPPRPRWDLGNGEHREGNPLTYTYPAPGAYNVVLTASESRCGQTRLSDPLAILVEDAPPCDAGEGVPCGPGFSVSAAGPYGGAVGDPILFNAVVTLNPGETVTEYLWEFGDGATASKASPKHAYTAESLYLVKLTVRSSHGYELSATTTANVQRSVAQAGCRDCVTDLFFAYDPAGDTLVGYASISIKGGTTEATDYDPYLRVFVVNPEGFLAFDSGYVAGRVQIPTPEALRHPRSGSWSMIADFWYRDRFGRFPIFFRVDLKTRTVIVPPRSCDAPGTAGTAAAAVPCKVSIEPAVADVIDGNSVAYSGVVTGGPPASQKWSTAPPPPDASKDPAPNVSFSPPDQLAAVATPRWYARPDRQCPPGTDQALENSRYVVLLDVETAEGPAQGKAEMTVKAPWGIEEAYSVLLEDGGLAGGMTPHPKLEYEVSTEFHLTTPPRGIWKIKLDTLVVKRVPRGPIQLAPGLTTSSVFYEKYMAHEKEHERFLYEAGQPGMAYWTEAAVRQLLTDCTNDGRCTAVGTASQSWVLKPVVERVLGQWEEAELIRWHAHGEPESERAAFAVSDKIPPHYLFQNCGRY